jgi:hypothetical protein
MKVKKKQQVRSFSVLEKALLALALVVWLWWALSPPNSEEEARVAYRITLEHTLLQEQWLSEVRSNPLAASNVSEDPTVISLKASWVAAVHVLKQPQQHLRCTVLRWSLILRKTDKPSQTHVHTLVPLACFL